MKKFKVIALSVGGLGNKIFNSGEIVSENNFLEGSTSDLVKQGFLKAHKLTAKEEKTQKAADSAAQKAADEEAQLNAEIIEEAKKKAKEKAERLEEAKKEAAKGGE